jgi:hypothetical protein
MSIGTIFIYSYRTCKECLVLYIPKMNHQIVHTHEEEACELL